MSELPEIGVARQSDEHKMFGYDHYFGQLDQQVAINGVTAYLDKTDVDGYVATAYIFGDETTLEGLLGSKHRTAKLHAALMRASTIMWSSIFMQKVTMLLSGQRGSKDSHRQKYRISRIL